MSEEQNTTADNSAATETAGTRAKRKARTPEEILKDIEAQEQEQIRKIQARAAERKAEVKKKLSAAAKKGAAVDLINGFRSGIKDALKNPDLSDDEADRVLEQIVKEGLTQLSNKAVGDTAANTAAMPLAA